VSTGAPPARAPVRSAAPARTGLSQRRREALVGYAFVLVPMGVFLVFFIFPMLYAAYISVFDWGVRGRIDYVGLGNYRELLGDQLFWRAVRNTVQYAVEVVALETPLGLALALIVNSRIRGKTFFRAAFYFPAIASSAAITAIFIFILSSDGLVNHVLGWFGLPSDTTWFSDDRFALHAIVGLNAWTTAGTVMLFYLAALQAIPTDVYEAAAIDRASRWRTFWKVTMPLLKPGHFFVFAVTIIGALKVFDQAYIVSRGEGGPNYSTLMIVLQLFRSAINDLRFGYAAAMGVFLFVFLFAITLAQKRIFGNTEAS
jgi:multiple sugar transport system permease protein